MSFSYYPNNPDWNDAAVLLDMMTPEQIGKIVHLVNSRGTAVITDIKQKETGNSMTVLAVLDEKFVPSKEQEAVALGLSTILMDAIRKPRVSGDSYENVLMNAFSLPSGMAAAIAKKIETEDIFGASYKDPSGKEVEWYTEFIGAVKKATRETLNAIPSMFSVPWEIDADQDYDIDFLYELKLLGEAVSELETRARLMAGQAALNESMGLMQTGDVEELGDIEAGDIALGDAIKPFTLRKVPSLLFGKLKNLKKVKKRREKAAVQAISQASGITPNSAGTGIVQKRPSQPFIKRALEKALNAKPSAALALGALFGATPAAIKLLKSLKSRNRSTGDIGDVEEVGDAIAADYGNSAASAWLSGNIPMFLSYLEKDAQGDVETGDPDLDEAIEQEIANAALGDVENMGPELGGLFMRARINRAKRRFARRKRRAWKRKQLQDVRDADARQDYGIPEGSTFNPSSEEGDDSADYSDSDHNSEVEQEGDVFGIGGLSL